MSLSTGHGRVREYLILLDLLLGREGGAGDILTIHTAR